MPQIDSRLSRAIDWALYPLLIAVAAYFCTIRPISDPDCWFHMALGRHVLDAGSIPKGDIFSYTANGSEWISSGWLASVLYEFFFRWIGPGGGGLVLLVFIAVAGSLLVLFVFAQLRYRTGPAIVPLLLAAILASYLRYTPRPDTWSPLMLALLLVTLTATDEKRRGEAFPWTAFLLPLVMLLWANMHAGFMAGVVVLAIYSAYVGIGWMRHRRKSDLVVLAGCALGGVIWLANPYGIRILALAGKIRNIPGYRSLVYEWMPLVAPPGLNLPMPAYVGVALVLLFAAFLVRTTYREIPWWRYAVIAFFAVFASVQRRQLGLFVIAVPAMLLPYARLSLPAGRAFVLPIAATALALSICVMQVAGTLQAGAGWPGTGRECRSLPCIGTDFYEQNRPPGNMYNTYGIGGYLLYQLAPQTKVFIDGRLDIYPTQVWLDYLAVDEGRMPLEEFCRKYDVTHFFIESKGAEAEPRHLAARLARNPEWALVFFDDDHSIFVRNEPRTVTYVQQFGFKYVNPFTPERLAQAAATPATRNAAFAEIQRGLELSNGSANANALAGFTARQFGDQAAAAMHLQAALARAPENPLARRLAAAK